MIMYGKGKRYSKAAREIEGYFQSWLALEGIDETEFDRRIINAPVTVEDNMDDDGNMEVGIVSGDIKIIMPLIYQQSLGTDFREFIVDAVLLLLHIASRYENKGFEESVRAFADKYLEGAGQ